MSGILMGFVGGTYGRRPDPPTIGTASYVDRNTASVTYTAPGDTGGAAIISYTATASPGGVSATVFTSASGSITVPGLSPYIPYTFTVTATSIIGTSSPSAASNSLILYGPGQVEFTSATETYWTVPYNVTSVCVVCVGGGGSGQSVNGLFRGGGGGGLGWKNNIPVTPGQTYFVRVGPGATAGDGGSGAYIGGTSYFGTAPLDLTIVYGEGGTGGPYGGGNAGGAYLGDGGGNGGNAGASAYTYGGGGGGGAGGYSGAGGNGGFGGGYFRNSGAGTAGSGGGGGGGGGGVAGTPSYASNGCAGGGVGIYGQGGSGAGGQGGVIDGSAYVTQFPTGGGGGSSGSSGGSSQSPTGGLFGGGGAALGGAAAGENANGGGGAVRIIWGTGRAFPSTNTGNV